MEPTDSDLSVVVSEEAPKNPDPPLRAKLLSQRQESEIGALGWAYITLIAASGGYSVAFLYEGLKNNSLEKALPHVIMGGSICALIIGVPYLARGLKRVFGYRRRTVI